MDSCFLAYVDTISQAPLTHINARECLVSYLGNLFVYI